MKNCATCPSYVTADTDIRRIFGRNTGTPMCARYGHALGRPGLDDTALSNIGEDFAMRCDAYGEPIPETPVTITPRVVTPDMAVIAAGKTGESVRTCSQCTNCVSSDTVMTDFGWPHAICRAKGTIILKPRAEAVGCPYAKPGVESTTTRGLQLLPQFQLGFTPDTAAAVAAVVSGGGTDNDPRTYKTDKPVSLADAERGIRAWRKVLNPDNGSQYTFAPIYDPDKLGLSQEERSLIPQAGDDEHPELYVDYDGRLYSAIVESWELDETFALIGPAGTGKTEFCRWMAYLMQLPFHRFTFNNESDPEDMIGMMGASSGSTQFNYGRVPIAWQTPCVMLFDEPNTAPDAIWQVLRPLTDNSKQLVVDAAGGVRIPRNDNCFFVMAMNPSWDMRNIGTREISDADTRRLSAMYVEMPPPSIERHIITTASKVLDDYDVPKETVDLIMKIAEDIREMSSPEQGTYPHSWGIAQQIKVTRKTRWYTVPVAYKRAALDLHDPATSKLVLDAIDGHLKKDRPKRRSDTDYDKSDLPF